MMHIIRLKNFLAVISISLLAFCFEFSIARANTIYTGFTTTLVGGAGGIFGNGYVFASPIYSFAPGSTVDFGIAHLVPDPPDGRAGGCAPPYDSFINNNCYGNGGYEILYIAEGEPLPVIDPFGNYGTSFIYCNFFIGDCSVDIPLVIAFSAGLAGVQFVFQGTSVTNTPAVPLPGALPLFAAGLGAMGFMGWRKKRNPSLRKV